MVGGIRVSTAATTGQTDFAWLAAAPPLAATARFSVPTGPAPVLHLANPTTTDVALTLVASGGGADLTIAVPAGASALAALDPGTTYELSDFEQLFAGITLSAPGAIARYAVHAPGEGSSPVLIYP